MLPYAQLDKTAPRARPDREDDIAAIRQLIADVETGFNTNDAELLVSPSIRNGSAVNVAAVLLSGFQAMLESARAGLARPLRNQYASFTRRTRSRLSPQ